MLCDISVSDDIYEALVNSESQPLTSDDLTMSFEQADAMEWLASNVKEDDACEFKFEIECID